MKLKIKEYHKGSSPKATAANMSIKNCNAKSHAPGTWRVACHKYMWFIFIVIVLPVLCFTELYWNALSVWSNNLYLTVQWSSGGHVYGLESNVTVSAVRVFVISMVSIQQRHDNARNICHTLSTRNISCEIVPAIDGITRNISQLRADQQLTGVIEESMFDNTRYSTQEIALIASHINILQKCAHEEFREHVHAEFCIIIEDDAILCQRFLQRLERYLNFTTRTGWDLIGLWEYFPCNHWKHKAVPGREDMRAIRGGPLIHFYSSVGIIYSHRGVLRVLRELPCAEKYDLWLESLIRKWKLKSFLACPTMLRHGQFKSILHSKVTATITNISTTP